MDHTVPVKIAKKSEGLTTHQRAARYPRAAYRPACVERRDKYAAAALRSKRDTVSHSKDLQHIANGYYIRCLYAHAVHAARIALRTQTIQNI